MRSVQQPGEERILAAAIDLFGRQGFDGTSVRQLADSAAVSPALVIHHFGSKVGLRDACDEHVLTFLKSERANVLLGTVDFDSVRGYLAEHPEVVGMSRYLSQALARGDQASRQLFNRLIDDARDNLVLGEQRGMIRPSADPEARAAVLVAWTAGLRMFGDLVAERLGGSGLLDPEVSERVADVTLEIYEDGLLTDDSVRRAMRARADQAQERGSATETVGTEATP